MNVKVGRGPSVVRTNSRRPVETIASFANQGRASSASPKLPAGHWRVAVQRLWTFVLALQTAASQRIAATGKLISLHRLKRRVC